MALAPWETLADEVVLDATPWFRVRRESVRRRGGTRAHDFYMIDKGDFAVVCALDDEGRVLLTRQYRHGVPGVTLDLPAGFVEAGEEPLAAMRRELREETGHEAASWRHLATLAVDANRGYGRAHLFLAQGARLVTDPVMDSELEEIEVVPLAMEEAIARALVGELRTLAPVACLALAAAALRGA